VHALANRLADIAQYNFRFDQGVGSAKAELSNGGSLIAVVSDRPSRASRGPADLGPGRLTKTFHYRAPGEKYSKGTTIEHADELLRRFAYPDDAPEKPVGDSTK
jgi:hypothetical protein